MRRTLILVAVITLSTAAVVVGVSSIARPADAALPPTNVFGAALKVESQIDNSYCIQVDGGTGEGRALSLQQCTSTDTQQWTFTHNANGTNFVVESQGMCLDGHVTKATEGDPMTVAECGITSAWRFTVTPSGLIENLQNHQCLAVPVASANAAVALVPCDETRNGQRWKFAH
jgi:hypothetical protein